MFVAALGYLSAADQDEKLTLARYDILLREIHSYQTKADEIKNLGKSDTFLRRFHKDRLDLTSERSDQLTQLARRYTQAVRVVDRKAHEIIQAAKLKYRPSANAAPLKVPPPPAELQVLRNERNQITESHIKQIEEAFGPSDFRYFDTLVRRHVEAGYKSSRDNAGGGK